ncbi:MAG TPA: flagellar basal-body MS-ring/collar protein FliF [Rhizomicrobium sp.]|jgi:flagellar M-ring protein FliF|nr:flagellar basal-body MS-ring/collar protein FliF [Rhizomicrobium sp.]
MLDRFRSLSPSRQLLLVGGAVLVIAVLFAAVWLFLLRADYQPLFTDLRTADAATIVADLDKRRIPYRLADGGGTVLVPADQVDATRLAVMSTDLPLKGTVGFELFNKADLGLTDFAQKINYQRALQGELERTIMTLDGVEQARVHLSLGEDRIFRDDRVPPKASVTIRMRRNTVLSSAAAQGMRRLVAAAVPQMDPASVVILDEAGQEVLAHEQSAATVDASALSPALEKKQAIEEYYQAKLRAALDAAFSQDAVTVSVSAAISVSPDGEAFATNGGDLRTGPTRAFPLVTTLRPRLALADGWQDTARTAIAQIVGVAEGDAIRFAEPLPEEPAPDERVLPVAQPRVIDATGPLAKEEPGWMLEAAIAAAPILLLVAVLLVLRRARRPRRLSAQQRADLVARLRRALEKEADGAVQVS